MLDAHSAATAAYGGLAPQLVDPTRAEALVFGRVTRRLEAVFRDPNSSHSAKASVLYDNRRLWLAAAAATADDGNKLPEALRVSIISLSGFVEKHSRAVLNGTGDPGILFEINRRVAGGLSHGAR